jgi:hypothetical protein
MSAAFDISISETGEKSLTFVSHQGVLVTLPGDHPNFNRISHALLNGDDPTDLLDLNKVVQALDGRVTVENGQVFYEGEPTHGAVARTILRYEAEGRDFGGLVKFLERLFQNPSRRSRDQLWSWLERQDLAVDADGFFLAFKGVNPRYEDTPEFPKAQYPYQSSHSGPAIVDDKPFNGHVPQGVGAVVQVDRTEVDDDYRNDCSYGLHVGTFQYASGFAKVLEEVRVDPADVVTVPEYDTNKLRCAKYEVIGIQERKVNDLSHHEPEATFSDEAVVAQVEERVGAPKGWFGRLKSAFAGGGAQVPVASDDEEI